MATSNLHFLNFFNSSFEDSLLRPIAMVSRRKILSRSRDDLNLDSDNLQDSDPNGDLNPYNYRNNRRINLMDSEDDVWYHKDKLYKVSYLNPFIYLFENGKSKLKSNQSIFYKLTI